MMSLEIEREKATHTPGPWKSHAPAIWNKKHTEKVVNENYRYVEARSGYLSDDPMTGFSVSGYIRPEDARLMAAAPEMHEALEGLLAYLREFWPLEPLFSAYDHRQAVAISDAEAALRKAMGEQ